MTDISALEDELETLYHIRSQEDYTYIGYVEERIKIILETLDKRQ